MKHGRRHDKLKEQAYLARKDAEGYARPYRPIDVGPRSDEERPPAGWEAPEDVSGLTLADALSRKSKNAVKRAQERP